MHFSECGTPRAVTCDRQTEIRTVLYEKACKNMRTTQT